MKGVENTALTMWLISSDATSPPLSSTSPLPAFVNVAPLHVSKLCAALGPSYTAVVLLENPVGQNLLTYSQLVKEVRMLGRNQGKIG